MPKTAVNDFEKALMLSHFTLENIQEAVFWVNSSGSIIDVNPMACKMTGRSREELLSMKVPELNPSEIVQDFSQFWKRLKREKKIVFEAQHRHKDGHLYDVEIAGNYIKYEGQEFSCSIVRDIRKRKMEEDLLRTVSEATSSLSGKDFFIELAKHITLALSMKYALITECTDKEKTRLRTLCYLDGQVVLDNIEYDVAGTPCEIIMRGEDFFMDRGVQEFFSKRKRYRILCGCSYFQPG